MDDSNSPKDGVKLNSHIRRAANLEINGDSFSFKQGATACIMILEPLSPLCNYFEYVILDRGLEAAIGIGIAGRKYSLNQMPGWYRNSIGYHADNGKLYHEVGVGERFGPTCTTGDRMGCGIDFDQDYSDGCCTVFFTKNGEQVSHTIRMKRPLHGLYPIIGLHSQGEKVQYLGHWHRQRESLLEPMIVDTSPHNQWLRSNGIHYLDDGMTLEYGGSDKLGQDPALAQARFPLNRTNHYFELVILNSGTTGAIAIGLAKCTYELRRHPGWSQGSVGYHADDGKLFVEDGKGSDVGPPCSEGDRMGCGILFDTQEISRDEDYAVGEEGNGDGGLDNWLVDEEDDGSISDLSSDSSLYDDIDDMVFGIDAAMRRNTVIKHSLSENNSSSSCVVFFTKNGELVGKTKINIPKDGLYPTVGLMSKGERVRVDLQPLSG